MCQDFAKRSGARITITDDPKKAVKGVDFIHTDVWVSMGEPIESWAERIDELMPFQVNSKLVAAAGNPRVRFMHCLPAFHNSETKVGARSPPSTRSPDGIEVTEEVFESPVNICFEQAGEPDAHHQGGPRGRARCNRDEDRHRPRRQRAKRGQPMTAENQRANIRLAAERIRVDRTRQRDRHRARQRAQVGLLALQDLAYEEVDPIRSTCWAPRPRR